MESIDAASDVVAGGDEETVNPSTTVLDFAPKRPSPGGREAKGFVNACAEVG